jgi:glucose/arabinose dehydrogenase
MVTPRFMNRVTVLAACTLLGACATQRAAQGGATEQTSAAAQQAAGYVQIPQNPRVELYTPRVIAEDLLNPRGVLRAGSGLLVAEAGKGDPAEPLSARLLALVDRDQDGTYASDERQVLLDGQRSMHILERMAMNRDEVFGLADIARGEDTVLLSAVDLDHGSKLYRIEDSRVSEWGSTPGNANSLAYDPVRKRWYAVQSFENTVVEVLPGGETRTVGHFAALAQGQDSVPAAIAHEPRTGQLLVVLFSGQVGGDTAGSGVDFVVASGEVVRFNPDTGEIQPVIKGLNAPVDVIVEPDHRLLVLEFCSAFVDPITKIPGPDDPPSHGGFAHFSGRLLRVDLDTGDVAVLATGLDQPTHMEREEDGSVLISEGQGTPMRLVPGQEKPEPLIGRIRRWSPPSS